MSNHNFQVLGFEAEITVVIPNDAEAFLPIVIKNGNLYNPENGFKWSPKNKAWQRQLTPNAMFTLKHYVKLPNLVIH